MSALQDVIETKARELHDENCVKDCDRLLGPYWLIWAEQAVDAALTGNTE